MDDYYTQLKSHVIKGFNETLRGPEVTKYDIPNIENIFEGTPKIINYHFDCRIKGPTDALFPLDKMCMDPRLKYEQKVSARIRVLLFNKKGSPCVTFSKRGFLTVVGGGSCVEFRECVCDAILIIFWTLRHLFPSTKFEVGDWRINNKGAHVKVKGRFFLARLEDILREGRFKARVNPKIGFLCVKEVLDGKVTLSICANGKINISKFKYNHEAIKALYHISPYLQQAMTTE